MLKYILAGCALAAIGNIGLVNFAQADCVTQIKTECTLEVRANTFFRPDGSGSLDGEFVHASGASETLAKLAVREACSDRFAGTVNRWSTTVFLACKKYVELNPALLVCAPASSTNCSCEGSN